MNCIRVGWGSVASLHAAKLKLCGVDTLGFIDIDPAKKDAGEGVYCESYEQALSLKPDFKTSV